MKKPTWATVLGIFMMLIGGCGAFNDLGDINADKFLEMQAEMLDEIEDEVSAKKEMKKDTLIEEDKTKKPEIDSSQEKVFEFFGDSIVRDSNNRVDAAQTLKGIMKISDYRIKWTKTFGYIGLCISLLFLLAGILFLAHKKFTIPVAISVLALSIAFGIFQYIIFKADDATSNMLNTLGNFEIYWSLFLDVMLLMTIMVLDKSYYNESKITEDYYD